MAAADAEIEQSFELSADEASAAEALDDIVIAQRMGLLPSDLLAKRAKARARYAANRDPQRKSCRKYYESHKAEIKVRKAAWYQANREKIRSQQAEYRKNNRKNK